MSAVALPGSKNVMLHVDGKTLFITCDLSKEFGPSSSGKTVVIASSSGNKPLGKSGAFLGLNLFTKSLEKRDLSAKCVADLKQKDFQPIGDGCAWRIEPDGVTVCVRIDFAAIKERPASSGKSVLLATSGGNKMIGSTGVMCGLNCYRSTNGTLDVSKLTLDGITGAKVGATEELGDGFALHYTSPTEAEITFTGTLDMKGGGVTSIPACRVGEVTVAGSIGALKAKRARKEVGGGDNQGETASSVEGGFIGITEAAKVRNLAVACTSEDGEDGHISLRLTFDPSQSLGRSSSGKSMTVSTSGGFQMVASATSGGEPVCRVTFNAYKPAPPLTDAEIDAAVKKVLAGRQPDDMLSLSFKAVLAEVIEAMGLAEGQEALVKERVKVAVKEYVSSASQSQ